MDKVRAKMDVNKRAAQFLPFAALKGFEEALLAKEKIRVDKIVLSPEMEEELDKRMHEIKKGDIAEVTFFEKDEYLKVTGMVAQISETARVIRIVNKKIGFDEILSLQKIV